MDFNKRTIPKDIDKGKLKHDTIESLNALQNGRKAIQ